MYWVGLVFCLYLNGFGFLFAPPGKRMMGGALFLTYLLWTFTIGGTIIRPDFPEGTAINLLFLLVINITSARIYRNIWTEYKVKQSIDPSRDQHLPHRANKR